MLLKRHLFDYKFLGARIDGSFIGEERIAKKYDIFTCYENGKTLFTLHLLSTYDFAIFCIILGS